MLVVSMICWFGLGLNIWFWFWLDRCVYSGSILVLWYLCCFSDWCVLWILCLFGRKISMLLCVFRWVILLMVDMMVLLMVCLFWLLFLFFSVWQCIFIGQVWFLMLIIGVLLKCWVKCLVLMVVEVMISFRFGCLCSSCFRQFSRKLILRLCLCVLLMMIVLQFDNQWLLVIFVSRMLLVMNLMWLLLLILLLKCIWQFISWFSLFCSFCVMWLVIVCVVICCGCVQLIMLVCLWFVVRYSFGSWVVLFELVLLVIIIIWWLWISLMIVLVLCVIGSCGFRVMDGCCCVCICWCCIDVCKVCLKVVVSVEFCGLVW